MSTCWLQGRNRHGSVLGGQFENVGAARSFARRNRLVSYAIYEVKPGFHSTAQQEYLILHHNDPYWEAKGVNGV